MTELLYRNADFYASTYKDLVRTDVTLYEIETTQVNQLDSDLTVFHNKRDNKFTTYF
jgi:hypothetical protein